MKNKIFRAIFFVFLLPISCTSIKVNAQSVPVNYVGWYTYNGYHVLNESNKLALLLEGTIQRDNIIIEPIQWAYEIGLSYQFKNKSRSAFGYDFQYNIPYDAASKPYNSISRRIWEQYTFGNTTSRFSYRLRMEQIWTQQKGAPNYETTVDWEFENILRFKIDYNLPINAKYTATFYDEIFVNMYDLYSERLLNQNRIYAGLLFNLDEKHLWKINAGYMFQAVWNSQDSKADRKRINNVLRVSVISNIPLYKKKN